MKMGHLVAGAHITRVCMLTVEHYNLPAGQEGIGDGWSRTISGLKTWLETGKAVKFPYMQEEA